MGLIATAKICTSAQHSLEHLLYGLQSQSPPLPWKPFRTHCNVSPKNQMPSRKWWRIIIYHYLQQSFFFFSLFLWCFKINKNTNFCLSLVGCFWITADPGWSRAESGSPQSRLSCRMATRRTSPFAFPNDTKRPSGTMFHEDSFYLTEENVKVMLQASQTWTLTES